MIFRVFKYILTEYRMKIISVSKESFILTVDKAIVLCLNHIVTYYSVFVCVKSLAPFYSSRVIMKFATRFDTIRLKQKTALIIANALYLVKMSVKGSTILKAALHDNNYKTVYSILSRNNIIINILSLQ